MRKSLRRINQEISALIADRTSGSISILNQMIRLLEDASEHPLNVQVEIFEKLEVINSDMVAIHHLINELRTSVGPNLRVAIDAYQQQWKEVIFKLHNNFQKEVDLDQKRILTHSNSGTLTEVLALIHRRGEEIKVIQTISSPGEEGKIQAQKLSNTGIQVKLIEDQQLPNNIPQADLIMLGMDQFDHQHFVNKIKTGLICQLANEDDIPTYVLGDTRKKVANVKCDSDLFEKVPFYSNIKLITEQD